MADLFCSDEFTPSDKLASVERELTYRRRVYERLVSEGKMKPETRDREIAIFEAIAKDYRHSPMRGAFERACAELRGGCWTGDEAARLHAMVDLGAQP